MVSGEVKARMREATATARALVEALEGNEPIDGCLMRAQRLARLLRDGEAQQWLSFEQSGYTADFDDATLGSCAKYCFRWVGKGKAKTRVAMSLPAAEAQKDGMSAALQKLQVPGQSAGAKDYLAAAATMKVMEAAQHVLVGARNEFVNASMLYSSLRAGVHRWATDTLIALELGDAAEDIFESARQQVDVFVGTHAPRAAEQLVAVEERMRDGTREAYAQALTSCRRILTTVADAVFPAQDAPYKNAAGKSFKVGTEQYKNRLLCFIDSKISSGSTRAIGAAQLEHLAGRLDAVYEKACKGVHDDVTPEEARLVVIETYVFLAEIARYAVGSAAA